MIAAAILLIAFASAALCVAQTADISLADPSNAVNGSVHQDNATAATARENVVAASEIISKMLSGVPVDYDNVTIAGDLYPSKPADPIKQVVKITNSTFLGSVDLSDAVFQELLDLRHTTFEGDVSFSNAQLLGDASFDGAVFAKDADFKFVRSDGLSSFVGTEFRRDASFRYARFNSPVTFGAARFDGAVSFANAQFGGEASLFGTRFAKNADFRFVQFSKLTTFMGSWFLKDLDLTNSQFGGQANFMSCQFQGNASFAAARFTSDVIFRDAEFPSNVTFGLANFGGISDFSGVNFSRPVFFGGARFADSAYFKDARFGGNLVLESARIYAMQLDNASFGKDSKIVLKDADFTKFVAKWSAIKDRLEFNGAAYLALVKNYKNLEWFDDADDCYFQYRWISQSQEALSWTKVVDIISWLSCGYGVRVSYVIFWCLVTIIIFGNIFWAGNGMRRFEHLGLEVPSADDEVQTKRVSLVDAVYFSVAMFTTSQAPVNYYPVGLYRHLAMIEGILGWFFLGLFVVVLSGMLIR
ncbi:MAG TPA: pentapeptide repeat-containing protein [Methanotrichaceae archaeon]|nr:pentapeptide repeat-containing protein [Methanotrichaceae archaeon]